MSMSMFGAIASGPSGYAGWKITSVFLELMVKRVLVICLSPREQQ